MPGFPVLHYLQEFAHICKVYVNYNKGRFSFLLSLGQEDSLEKKMAIQYFCWENPMYREAWEATVCEVA